MSSVLFGLGAAISWAAATLLCAVAARGSPPLSFAFAFLGAQALLVLPFGAAQAWGQTISAAELGLLVLAGVAQAVGVISYGSALRLTSVTVVAALVSLEGAVAALLAVVAGEDLGLLAGVGLLLATTGGLSLGAGGPGSGSARGTGLSVVTALAFGLALFLLSQTDLPKLTTLAVFNAGAALTVAVARRARVGRALQEIHARRALMGAAIASVAGYLCYAAGAAQGSVAVTAVLAAQFAAFTALGAYLWFNERLRPLELAAFVLLAAGVAAAAVGSS